MPKQFQPVFQVRFGSGMELCIEPRVGGFKPHQNAPRSRFIEGGVTLYTSCADAQKDKRPASLPYPLHHVDEHLIRVPKVLSGLQNKRLEAEPVHGVLRSEEHTSELQSQSNLVCRLLLEKKT